jgi:hypothetical protein
MATTTNYSWSTPDDTALVKDGAAAIRSLGTAIDTTVFNNAAAAINKSLVDAAGDLIYGTADNTVARLAIGTANQQLRVNSGATAPEWFTPSSGGITLISDTVASGNSSITLGSISGSYKELFLTWAGCYLSDNATRFDIRLNNDSGSNYHGSLFYFDNTSASVSQASGTGVRLGSNAASFGNNNNSTTLANTAIGNLRVYNYASATLTKNFDYRQGALDGGAGAGARGGWANGVYNSTTAITSIDIVRISGSGTLSNVANTSIRLYGVA